MVKSPLGHILQGIRDNEKRMVSLGYHVWGYKYLASIFAGLFAGLAGILHVYYNGYVSPLELSVIRSTEGLLMVLVGGAGTLFGPIMGATIVVFLSNIASIYTERWVLILGIIYVAAILFAPEGIYKPIKSYFHRRLSP